MTRTAAKVAPKTNRVFQSGLCHYRNEQGAPDCKQKVVRASANMCDRHEREWSASAKLRAAARKAAKPAPAKVAVQPGVKRID